MKLLTTLLLLLFVSFATAQESNAINTKDVKTKTTSTLSVEKTVVISVKGIRTMEEIDIENYNKTSYLKLIASKQQKSKTC